MGKIMLLLAFAALFVDAQHLQAAEQLQNITSAQEVQGQRRPVIVLRDGTIYEAALPRGFVTREDGALLLPDGVVIQPDGQYVLPSGIPAWQYSRREDGSVLTPYGIVRFAEQPDRPEATKPDGQAERHTPGEAPDDALRGNQEAIEGTIVPRRAERVRPDPQGAKPQAVAPDVVRPGPQVATPAQPAEPRAVELWELLPMTPVPRAQQEARQGRSVAEVAKKEPERKEVQVKEKKDQAEKKEQPKAPPAVKKGENVQIPPAASAKKDLSFLDGCWRSDPVTGGTWNNARIPPTTAVAEMCFDKRGKGRIHVIDSNLVCRGGASASFRGKNLVIESDNAKCPPNPKNIEMYTLRHWKCSGSGKATQCFLLSINPQGKHEVKVYRTHLRRK